MSIKVCHHFLDKCQVSVERHIGLVTFRQECECCECCEYRECCECCECCEYVPCSR